MTETFLCGYGPNCATQSRVESKGQLCPGCLEQELLESTNELEAHQ